MDMRKLGYQTTLIHSNAVVNRFKKPFNKTIDLSTITKTKKMGKKYHKVSHLLKKYLSYRLYRLFKQFTRKYDENYLPYARVKTKLETLDHILSDDSKPHFVWLHLMDPHTPYFPLTLPIARKEVIDMNDNQLSAVRGYYKPTMEEAKTWYYLYETEIIEMWSTLHNYLRNLDLDKNMVIFTSDHGEEFGEHGHYGHKGNRFNRENLEVPFLVYSENMPNLVVEKLGDLRRVVRRLVQLEAYPIHYQSREVEDL